VQLEQNYFFFAVFFAAFLGAAFFAAIKYSPPFVPAFALPVSPPKAGQCGAL
jgi:hypothetical protein